MNQCNLHFCRHEGPFCPMCAQEAVAKLRYPQMRGNEAQRGTDYTAGSILGREEARGTKVDATLAERGARYGDFTDHARIAEALHGILIGDTPAGKFNTSWGTMKPFQRQALRVIVDKLARILNGDPDYVDNWHDIQGYAKLVEERLTK